MNVESVMTRHVWTCSADDSLNTVAQLMWENDCGAIVVVDSAGKAVGMVTDRDVCMASYTQGQPLTNMRVISAFSHGLVSVREGDNLAVLEALMQKHRVRRVPVLNAEGKPVGIVTMNDLARNAQRGGTRKNGLTPESIVRTLAAVCQPGTVEAQAAE